PQLLPHLAGAVNLAVLPPHPLDGLAQPLACPCRSALGLSLPGLELIVQRRGDRQHSADRLDPVLTPVGVDERRRHFAWRSSSAFAKYADARRRISFAHLSSRFSRSSSFSRALSSVVKPGRRPWSRSAWRTHFLSVSAVQPI